MAGPRRRAPPPPATTAVPLWAVMLGLTAVVLAAAFALPPDTVRSANHRLRGRFRTADTVILVVQDALRADHASLCGYARPTTPALVALAAAGEARHSCAAVAPASWAIPSVASLFTGQPVPEHGVDTERRWTSDGTEVRPVVHPLPSAAVTLAERFVDQGYQTALVSENPLINDRSGLQQGFFTTRVAPRYPGARGDFSAEALGTLLRTELDPARPLFLTLVLAASHEPLSAVPGGINWLPRTSALGCFGVVSPTCAAFLDRRLRPADRETFLTELNDLYDFGVSRSDAHLGHAIQELDRWGWRSGPWRMAVVGSNGTALGEEGMLGAGNDVTEALVRVPLVLASSASSALPVIAADMTLSTLDVSAFLSGDTWVTHPVVSYGNRPAAPRRGSRDLATTRRAAAAWEGTRKSVWRDGAWFTVDLAEDPQGTYLSPLPGRPDGLIPDIDRWLDGVGRGPLDLPATAASPAPG